MRQLGVSPNSRHAHYSPEELVRDCQQTLPEDSRSFELLVAQYKGMVFRTAYRLMGNRQDADDQAQEVFLKIFRGIMELDNPNTLTSWIYRITVNTCLDALRKEKRNPARMVGSKRLEHADQADEEDIPDTQSLTPEQAVAREEALRCLEDTWIELEPTNRVLLALREIEERSYDEIAKILQVGLSAVKMRIHRARLVFKQLLDQICPDLYEQLSNQLSHHP